MDAEFGLGDGGIAVENDGRNGLHGIFNAQDEFFALLFE